MFLYSENYPDVGLYNPQYITEKHKHSNQIFDQRLVSQSKLSLASKDRSQNRLTVLHILVIMMMAYNLWHYKIDV